MKTEAVPPVIYQTLVAETGYDPAATKDEILMLTRFGTPPPAPVQVTKRKRHKIAQMANRAVSA